jgi:hypothetical protein
VPQCSCSEYELGESPAGRYSDGDSGELYVEEVPEGNVEVEGLTPLAAALLEYWESWYGLASEGGNWYDERELVLIGA